MITNGAVFRSHTPVLPSTRFQRNTLFLKRPGGRGSTTRIRSEDPLVDDIYIGDGRVIKDDPTKYPSREDAGFIQGATGGWAGGEIGLQRFLEEIDSTERTTKTPTLAKTEKARKVGEGSDKLYVGFDYKDPNDLTALREGKQGKFIIDDASKYPGRDFLGWLPLQGGFAGGEIGLKKFVEEGDIKIAGPEEKGRSQMSPVMIGIFVAAVATTGGLLLTDVIDFSENLSINVGRASLDEKTKLLLEIAVGLLFAAWVGSASLAFLKTAREKIDSGTNALQRVVISLVFWAVVLVATYNLAKA